MLLSEEVKAYFENLISPLVKIEDLNKSLEEFKNEIVGTICKLEARLDETKKIIDANAVTIERLDSELKIVRNALNLSIKHADDNEQYSRRCSLRINGLPVNKNEDVKELVKDCYENTGVEFVTDEIDRMHRTGKAVFDNKKKEFVQPILVKYRYWDARMKFYKARPKFSQSESTRGNQSNVVSLYL